VSLDDAEDVGGEPGFEGGDAGQESLGLGEGLGLLACRERTVHEDQFEDRFLLHGSLGRGRTRGSDVSHVHGVSLV
jgi:hypothetical protein